MVLYYGGEKSIEDVASALGISPDSARQRVHRGRARLRDVLETVETVLRATRPTSAFTAACVAAWVAGKPTPSHAAAIPKRPRVLAIGAGVAALAVSTAVVIGVARDRHEGQRIATTSPSTDPRAALQRRFPASPRPIARQLPPGTFALAPSSTTVLAASPAPAAPSSIVVPEQLVEFEFRMAPFVDLMRLFRKQLDTPIWVAYETDATIDINTHGKRPTIEVFDEVLDMAGANRAEVAAIRIVAGGRTDASVFGGEPVTLTFRNTPLNFVLDALEPKLGMPIGRLAEVIPGTVDEDGKPLVEASPPVTLELHDVPAGAALEQALSQAGLGYELTTGFVILPR